jgi:hypothetical protein
MGIKEQMEVAEKLAALEEESRIINDNILSFLNESRNLINKFEINICNEIKNKILAQGKSNNFEIIEKDNNWSMKYKSLEYKGNFTSSEKYVERIDGTDYSKVEFVLELEKHFPNRDISLTGSYKNVIEQMEERIKKEKVILDEYQEFKETLKDTDITIKYKVSKRYSNLTASLYPRHNENYIPLNIEELVKTIIG